MRCVGQWHALFETGQGAEIGIRCVIGDLRHRAKEASVDS